MGEMIDHVAKALCDAEIAPGTWPCDVGMYRHMARAAIEAMRQPTDAMFGGLYGVEARRQFTDMIDAALKLEKV